MSERDELAKAVFVADNYNANDDVTLSDWEALVASDGDGSYVHRIAQGLIQAGYRKPRAITTAEELDALPFGSVVIRGGTQGKAWQKLDWHDSNGQLTTNWCTYGNKLRDSETLIRRGSFTVLWEPR